MNRTIASLIGFGAGIAAMSVSRGKGLNGKQMKRLSKRMRNAFR